MSDEITIALTGAYRLNGLDRLLRDLSPCFSVERPTQLHFDMRRLGYISAAALAILVAVMHDLDERNLTAPGSLYLPPKNFLVERYLARMDFERLLVHPVPDEGFSRRKESAFRPCQVFSTESELASLADSLTTAVMEACDVVQGTEAAIWFALNELAQNVVQHARAPAGGVCVAQNIPSQKQFEVAIADCGIGVRASLAANPIFGGISTDADALREALRPGVSGKPRAGGGVGLYLTRLLLRDSGGSLMLRSGTASATSGQLDVLADGRPLLPGTLAVLRAPADQPLDLRTVLRAINRPTQVES